MQTASNLALSVSTESPQISSKSATKNSAPGGGFDESFKAAQSAIRVKDGSKNASNATDNRPEGGRTHSSSHLEPDSSGVSATHENQSSDSEEAGRLSSLSKTDTNTSTGASLDASSKVAKSGNVLQENINSSAARKESSFLASGTGVGEFTADSPLLVEGGTQPEATASSSAGINALENNTLQLASGEIDSSDLAQVPANVSSVGATVAASVAGNMATSNQDDALPSQLIPSERNDLKVSQVGDHNALQVDKLSTLTESAPVETALSDPSLKAEAISVGGVLVAATDENTSTVEHHVNHGEQIQGIPEASLKAEPDVTAVKPLQPVEAVDQPQLNSQEERGTLALAAGIAASGLDGQSVMVTNSADVNEGLVSQNEKVLVGDKGTAAPQMPDVGSALKVEGKVEGGPDESFLVESEASKKSDKALNTAALSSALLASTKALSHKGGQSNLTNPTDPVVVASQDSSIKNSNNDLGAQTLAPSMAVEASNDDLSWVLSQMEKKPNPLAGTSVTALTSAMDDVKVNESVSASAPVLSDKFMSEGAKLSAAMALGLQGDAEQSAKSGLESLEDQPVLEESMVKEPLELRKKEQDVLLNRMAGSIDRPNQEMGGLTSSTVIGQSAKALAAGATASAQVAGNNNPTHLAMSVPPNHPNWTAEMAQKVTWVAREGGHTAHIQLDPPELGSLTVKVSVDSDSNTQVSFVAATAQTRDMIEGQMHRLREMLAQQGMDLNQVDVDVAERDASNTQFAGDSNQNGQNTSSNPAIDDDLEVDSLENTSYVSANGVDYYA